MIALIAGGPGLIAAIGSIISAIMGASTKKSMNLLEKNTNSIKDELVKVTETSAFAKGKLEGQKEAKEN